MTKIFSAIGFAIVVATAAAFAPLPATAATIDWTLHDVVFQDFGTASGTFSTDSATGNVTAFDITTTTGATVFGQAYNATNSHVDSNNFFSENSFIIATTDVTQYINFQFVNPLTSPGVNPFLIGVITKARVPGSAITATEFAAW